MQRFSKSGAAKMKNRCCENNKPVQQKSKIGSPKK
jgi:hypothetical protein